MRCRLLPVLLVALAGPALAQGALAQGALAQGLGKEAIIEGLAPPPPKPLTRALKPGAASAPTRQSKVIKVEPGREDQVLAEIKEQKLPSLNFRVTFGYDSDVLTPEGVATLRPLGEALADPRLSASRFLIAGHTDAKGSDLYNQGLSERRARAVRDHLVAAYRLSPERIEAIGFGRRQPVEGKDPLDPANRRVEVVNLLQ